MASILAGSKRGDPVDRPPGDVSVVVSACRSGASPQLVTKSATASQMTVPDLRAEMAIVVRSRSLLRCYVIEARRDPLYILLLTPSHIIIKFEDPL